MGSNQKLAEKKKYIQDPIHGVITIDPKILTVIDHKAFQRLRKIKALGFLEMVFPSARHSRFEHSIGAMYVLEKLINEGIQNSKNISLKDDVKFSALDSDEITRIEEEKMYYLLAALLHDVGHGPFSHASETLMPTVKSLLAANENEPDFVKSLIKEKYKDESKKADHEVYTILIISKILNDSNFTEEEIKKVLAFKTGSYTNIPELKSLVKLIYPLIDGEFDCDRMDYLLRDSYFCGVTYGNFDFDRITKGICFLKNKDSFQICFKRKSLSALEDFIFSRFQMHSQVYTHRIDVACNESFKIIAKNSSYELPSEIESYIEINDSNLIEFSEGKLDEFSAVINERKLWRIVFESFNQDMSNESLIMNFIKSQLSDKEYSVKTTDKPFKKPSLLDLPMLIENTFGEQSTTKLSSISQLLAHYNGSLNVTRIFVHPEKFEEIKKSLNRFKNPMLVKQREDIQINLLKKRTIEYKEITKKKILEEDTKKKKRKASK